MTGGPLWKSIVRLFFSFEGRVNRAQFFTRLMGAGILAFFFQILFARLPMLGLVFWVSTFSLLARRLHDRGKSAHHLWGLAGYMLSIVLVHWGLKHQVGILWFLIGPFAAVFFVYFFYMGVLVALPGQQALNAWGPRPEGIFFSEEPSSDNPESGES
jgi:uncharacterized membrane protein YhaH (DUF805 family)